VYAFLKEYVNEAECHFNIKVKRIRCDNGGEYKNNALRVWCTNNGIVIEFTALRSPQLNGTAERMNRTIMEKARALHFDSGLGKRMWGEAVLTSAYLLNRSPTETVK
jgi:transposase InsO family protein